MSYPLCAVTVDVALFTIEDDTFKILLIERGGDPYRGKLALPGGFVHRDEGLDAAAARELEKEAGLGRGARHLEQLAAYGDPARDPRMRTVTVAFWAITAGLPGLRGGRDTAAARLLPVDWIEDGDLHLAFDHDRIVRDAVERIRSRLETTTVAARFCPPAFTVAELRRVYEAIWNISLDPGNFQRFVRDSGAFTPEPSARSMSLAEPPSARLHSESSLGQSPSGWNEIDAPWPTVSYSIREIGNRKERRVPSSDSASSPDLPGPREETRHKGRGRPASRWMLREGRPRMFARPMRRKADDA